MGCGRRGGAEIARRGLVRVKTCGKSVCSVAARSPAGAFRLTSRPVLSPIRSRIKFVIFLFSMRLPTIRRLPGVTNFAQCPPWNRAFIDEEGIAGRRLVAVTSRSNSRVVMEPSNYLERLPPANLSALADCQSARDIDDASALAHAIVDTIRSPLLVLDQDLRVVTANRSFYQTFRMKSRGRSRPSGLRTGQWTVGYCRTSAAAG